MRRRALLAAPILALPTLAPAQQTAAFRVYSCARDRTGSHHLAEIDWRDGTLRLIPLPGRGHHVAVSPETPWCAAPARRPGDWLLLWNRRTDHHTLLRPPAGYFFTGHAVFAENPQFLYCSAQHTNTSRGAVLVVDTFAREPRFSGALDTHGIGPHAIAFDPRHRHLVVCNGGLQTHPVRRREVTNAAHFASSLVRLSLTGERISQHVAEPGLSLRHLDLDNTGRAVVAAQVPAGAAAGVDTALVWLENPIGGPLQAASWQHGLHHTLQGYLGDVRWQGHGDVIATSAPSASVLRLGERIAVNMHTDVSGVAVSPVGTVLSDGLGRLVVHGGRKRRFDLAFDNHLSCLES
ncbi:MAG: DUF1513 domain-containing protein [Pseudomonadota bacterium]